MSLRSQKVGTTEVEAQGLKIVEQGKGEDATKAVQDRANGISKRERIRDHRDPRIIVDLLTVKVNQCEREEKEQRRMY